MKLDRRFNSPLTIISTQRWSSLHSWVFKILAHFERLPAPMVEIYGTVKLYQFQVPGLPTGELAVRILCHQIIPFRPYRQPQRQQSPNGTFKPSSKENLEEAEIDILLLEISLIFGKPQAINYLMQ